MCTATSCDTGTPIAIICESVYLYNFFTQISSPITVLFGPSGFLSKTIWFSNLSQIYRWILEPTIAG